MTDPQVTLPTPGAGVKALLAKAYDRAAAAGRATVEVDDVLLAAAGILPHPVTGVEVLVRGTFIVLAVDRKKLLDALDPREWSLGASGPYSDASMFPKVDASRYRLVAEKVLVEVYAL